MKKLILLPSLSLLIGFFLKLRELPNQLLFVGFSFLLILIILIYFLVKEMKSSEAISLKLIHFLFFILSFIVIVLPYFNTWFPSQILNYEEIYNRGLIPYIHISLIIIVTLYFIKTNKEKITFLNLFQPTNYKGFVIVNSLLFFLNSPFQYVLPDNLYSPNFTREYNKGEGPDIYIDEAHNNTHTASGTYRPFANILSDDGYVIKAFKEKFTKKSLEQVEILVISNALNKKNIEEDFPVYSAFNDDEIENLNTWVKNGGALFLIADHAPFSGASKKLALTFGFEFTDGYALKKKSSKYPSDLFIRENNTLTENIITNGRNTSEYVDSVMTFVGQAFKIPNSAISILTFDQNYILKTLEIVNGIEVEKTESIAGYSQGAILSYGKGRVAVYGEAAMFTGQLPAGLSWIKRGFNSSNAKNNYKLLLNTIHWLENTNNF